MSRSRYAKHHWPRWIRLDCQEGRPSPQIRRAALSAREQLAETLRPGDTIMSK